MLRDATTADNPVRQAGFSEKLQCAFEVLSDMQSAVVPEACSPYAKHPVLGCSGSRLSNRPYEACYGLLCRLIGDTTCTYKVN